MTATAVSFRYECAQEFVDSPFGDIRYSGGRFPGRTSGGDTWLFEDLSDGLVDYFVGGVRVWWFDLRNQNGI